MENRFELFSKFSKGLLSYFLESFFGSGSKDKESNFLVLLAILICFSIFLALLYAGAEVVFLLTRTNFGTKGVKKVRAVLGSLVFLGLAFLCYRFNQDYYGIAIEIGSELSFLLASVSFLLIGIVVLFKAMTIGGKDDNDVIHSAYRGDSWLLGGLVKEKWQQSNIQDFAEPVLFLAIGAYLFSFNYVWGVPFIFCAISCWFHLAIEAVFGFFKDRKALSNEGLVYAQNHRTSQIIN